MVMGSMFEVQPKGQRNTVGNTEMNKEAEREGRCDKFSDNCNRR